MYSVVYGCENHSAGILVMSVLLYFIFQASEKELKYSCCREVRMSPRYSHVTVFCVSQKCEWVQDIRVLLYSVLQGSENESKIFMCHCILCYREVRMSPRYSCVIVFSVTGKWEWVQDIRVFQQVPAHCQIRPQQCVESHWRQGRVWSFVICARMMPIYTRNQSHKLIEKETQPD